MQKKAILSSDLDENRFATYSKRILGCFANLDLMPEPDIEDALESLNLMADGKIKRTFYGSTLFASLVKQALNLEKELPVKIRKSLVFSQFLNLIIIIV